MQVEESVRFLNGVSKVEKLLFGAFEITFDDKMVKVSEIENQMSIAGYPPEDQMRAEFIVNGIMCEVCAGKVKDGLSTLAGVESVNVNVSKKTVEIDFDKSKQTVDDLKAKLGEIGYPAD